MMLQVKRLATLAMDMWWAAIGITAFPNPVAPNVSPS
jgi:hypothetical protein